MERPLNEGYLTWSDEAGRAQAMDQMGRALAKAEPVVRGSSVYLNVGPGNLSVRDSFSRRDYEGFRRGEVSPGRVKDVMAACLQAYDSVGIVRNVFDLMSDFASKGMDVSHPNERIERFYKEWFRKVNGPERSERFLSLFYRTGNVIVKRQTARLKPADETSLRRSQAAPDLEVAPVVWTRREVPWRYTFLNPLSVDLLCEGLTTFVGPEAFLYSVRVPGHLARMVKSPRTDAERQVSAMLPADVRGAISRGQTVLPLDPAKVRVFHYKRDDWKPWATPMLTPILEDLSMLRKMKLADLAALDGAISSIRVWKLGSLEHKVMPNEGVIARLAEMLANNVAGGMMDLVWGPDVELVETSSEVYKFLGETKYAPVLAAIFQGLGVPPTLTGVAGQGGFTNNAMSLKTLIERLEYGRQALRWLWDEEIRIVQRAMDFRFPATLTFDRLLTDEAAEKQLLLNMADRGIISDETIQEIFGLTPEIERVRTRREARRRESGLLPRKAGPFHVDHVQALEKIFAQSGAYAPSEFGLELEERKDGQKTPVDAKPPPAPAPTQDGPRGQPGQGRPTNVKDQGKRDQRTPRPRTAQLLASMAWADGALQKIAELSAPAWLEACGKKSFRELTSAQRRDFDSFAYSALFSLERGGEVGEEELSFAARERLSIPPAAAALVRAAAARHLEESGREPGAETMRRLRASAYACWSLDFDEDGRGDESVPEVSRGGEEPGEAA